MWNGRGPLFDVLTAAWTAGISVDDAVRKAQEIAPNKTRNQIMKKISELRTRGKIPADAWRQIVRRQPDTVPDSKPATGQHVQQSRTYPTGLDGFRQLYDKSLTIPKKIKIAIDTHLARVGWMYDDDFRKVCGVKTTDWRRYAREFEHLQIRVDNSLVWGHPSIIDQMREVTLL